MQNAVPKGEGGMLAVLGSDIEIIEKLLKDNQNNFLEILLFKNYYYML